MNISRLKILLTSTLLAICALHAQGKTLVWEENFDFIPDQTPLDNIDGWKPFTKQTIAPLVIKEAGFQGNGARFEGRGSFKREMPVQPKAVDTGKSYELRWRFRIISDTDSYTIARFIVSQQGPSTEGVTGVSVVFNGGKQDGANDNFIDVSVGGRSWSSFESKTLADSHWEKDTWYEIIVTGISPDKTQPGDVISKLSIVDCDTGKALLQNEPLGRFGESNAFTTPNLLLIGNIGAKRVFDVDSLVLEQL